LTGRSFEHRKRWIEERILELGGIFAVAVHAYAVMSNHVHVVIEVAPAVAINWPAEEVARRWLGLFRGGKEAKNTSLELRIKALAAQHERIATLRQRLGCLSWFMRCLNEPVARRANNEDECSGRFWEGRYKCQALLDDPAVLASMVYVDLNPVRAGAAACPEESLHTSLRRRRDTGAVAGRLAPVATSIPGESLSITTASYLELVDWTCRVLHPAKRGVVPKQSPAALTQLAVRPTQWICQVPATESGYWRVIGSAELIAYQAHQLGRRWLRGLGFARSLDAISDSI